MPLVAQTAAAMAATRASREGLPFARAAARAGRPARHCARPPTKRATKRRTKAAMATTAIASMFFTLPPPYRGMLPCLRLGRDSRLPSSIERAEASRALVWEGSITSST